MRNAPESAIYPHLMHIAQDIELLSSQFPFQPDALVSGSSVILAAGQIDDVQLADKLTANGGLGQCLSLCDFEQEQTVTARTVSIQQSGSHRPT